MAGQTGLGGGTSIDLLLQSVDKEASLYGRKIEGINPEITTKNLSKYLDKGVPIMWACMVSHSMQTKPLLERNAIRLKTTDWEAWKADLEKIRKNSFRANPSGGHLRLIIGYNADTKEIAISDSWGKEFDEYWMTYEEATEISGGLLRIIKW